MPTGPIAMATIATVSAWARGEGGGRPASGTAGLSALGPREPAADPVDVDVGPALLGADLSARETVCTAVRELLAASSVTLWETDPHGGIAASASSGTRPPPLPLPGGADAPADAAQREPPATHLEPVRVGTLALGVLAIHCPGHRGLDATQRHLVRVLAEAAAHAMEHDRRLEALGRAAWTDVLTGLPNRRAWEHTLGRELARVARTEAPLAVALLDVDDFEAISQTHGDSAGDALLCRLAAHWQARTRAGDLLARIGGDEFGLLLPLADLPTAHGVLRRLTHSDPAESSISIGVAQATAADGPDELLERAGHARYAARRSRRRARRRLS